ncbi:uncharacterized protein LOC117181538 [Belonocnema kinseyi]|uniref:uncharacterized protein LOC117181538 n=1 Tax=Belonocnema kinseyi TaxID=2817044 RepID=UPI00143D82F7|nr:uncharacterized protein LOC117181538 [Belonocnema kinseyi]
MTVAEDCLEQVENDPTLLDQVITDDDSWFFQYNPETKRQSSQWVSPHAPRPKKARMSKSKVKTMIITFFDSYRIVHKEFVPSGQTVNQGYYRLVLERLRKRVNRVRPDITRNRILHDDNTPCHTTLSVSQYLASKGIAVLYQPPYSSDITL